MAYMSYLSSSWTDSHIIKYAELFLYIVNLCKEFGFSYFVDCSYF